MFMCVQRVDDEHMRRGRVPLGGVIVDPRGAHRDFLKR